MENQLTVKNENEVQNWNQEKWDLVLKTFIPKGISNKEALLFLELAKAYQLNPFKKEIWVIPYKMKNGDQKINIFCGRDGFLSIAHRSGMFDGMETNFGYDKNGNLESAETIVYNKSCKHPIKCKVFLKECSTFKNLWQTKPHVMLQKVAESTALRRAFNISGLYDPDEINTQEKISNNDVETNIITNNVSEVKKEKQCTAQVKIESQDDNWDIPQEFNNQKNDVPKFTASVKIDYKDEDGRARIKAFGFKWNQSTKSWVREVSELEYQTLLDQGYEIKKV